MAPDADATAGPPQGWHDLEAVLAEEPVATLLAAYLAAITAWRWTDERGEVLSTEKAPVLDLGAGRHELTLTVTDANGAVATDEVRVEMVAKARVLLAEDFSGGSIPVHWTIAD